MKRSTFRFLMAPEAALLTRLFYGPKPDAPEQARQPQPLTSEHDQLCAVLSRLHSAAITADGPAKARAAAARDALAAYIEGDQ